MKNLFFNHRLFKLVFCAGFSFTLIGFTSSIGSSQTSDIPPEQTSTPLTPDQQNLLAEREQCLNANITPKNADDWISYCAPVEKSLEQANLPTILTKEQWDILGQAVQNRYDLLREMNSH